MPWPQDKTTYRGTAMPADAFRFFCEGRKYRVSWALATSAPKDTAMVFKERSSESPGRPVTVIFHVDVSEDPYHVNHVEAAVAGEEEFLFVPYSCFKVIEILPLGVDDYVVRIKAYKDNKPQPG